MRFTIVTNDTRFKKFAQCDNSECKKIFLLFSHDLVSNNGLLLCPDCYLKVSTHHSVQCTSCLAVVSFIYAEPNETPIIYYVKKCSHCNGTLEDEKRIVPRHYPEAFV